MHTSTVSCIRVFSSDAFKFGEGKHIHSLFTALLSSKLMIQHVPVHSQPTGECLSLPDSVHKVQKG